MKGLQVCARVLPLCFVLAGCAGEIASPAAPGLTGAGAGTGVGAGTGTGSGNGNGAGVGGEGGGGSEPQLPEFEPAEIKMRQLLSWQYRNAVNTLLGAEAAAAVRPPGDVAINGLTAVGASSIQLGATAITAYEESAFAAAAAAMGVAAQRTRLIPCTPSGPGDDACMGQVVEKFGKRAFRRAFTAEEKTTWVKVGHDVAAAYNSFNRGVEFALAGMLQSPQFLYRVELGTVSETNPNWVEIKGYERASRLSFFLTGTIPTDALLEQAENGTLDTPAGVRAAAEAMVSEDGARDALWHFFDEMLQTNELVGLAKDSQTFPMYDPASAASMREETRRVIDDIAFTQDTDFRTFFTADSTFVDAKLAKIYGVTEPASGFVKTAYPTNQPRVGYFGSASFLALMAHPSATSPTYRGKFIREKILCEAVAAPPPEVNTALPETPAGAPPQTMREKIAIHMSAQNCKSCHALMDPMGLGFESFDALGRFREMEAGRPVDSTGALDGQNFTDAKGFAQLIKEDPRVAKCLSRTLYRQAAGHVEAREEGRPLKVVEDAFSGSGYRVKSLLVSIAESDALLIARRSAGVTP